MTALLIAAVIITVLLVLGWSLCVAAGRGEE